MSFTLTTPLYYVNDKPHIGSAYTTVACDALARFKRLEGYDVNFITGVDEHGQKIQRTAMSNNIDPIEHCNLITEEYLSLWDSWLITNDKFVRTSSYNHREIVNLFFKKVLASNDIYMGKQLGWYCVGCEEYKDYPENAKAPVCELHKKELEWRDEENLFFRLSKYQHKIEELINNDDFIQPKSRQNEIINFVAKGLNDFSISRVNIDWGIQVPGFPGHTFYVWFDALVGYISALTNSDKFDDIGNSGWPADIHIIGKDILRFHAVYWPAMLLSAGLPLPKKVFGHGFLTKDGQKMGKSLGNIIDPYHLVSEHGTDAIRWYLLKDYNFGNDEISIGILSLNHFLDIVIVLFKRFPIVLLKSLLTMSTNLLI